MKVTIRDVDDGGIYFSNGSHITYDHRQECRECNYADFRQIEDLALDTEFDWPIVFEEVKECGFRFGNKPQKMFFIPCYSIQNGYYGTHIEIYLDDKEVLSVDAELRLDY